MAQGSAWPEPVPCSPPTATRTLRLFRRRHKNRHGRKRRPQPTLGSPTPFIAQVCRPSSKTRRHAIHTQPSIFRTVKHVDSGSPGSIGSRLPNAAGETPFAWFHRSGMSPQQRTRHHSSRVQSIPLQADQTSHMFSHADYAEAAPATLWDPGPSVAGEASAAAGSQGWSSTAGEGASPEKVRRRKGRPRLYEDDGIEVRTGSAERSTASRPRSCSTPTAGVPTSADIFRRRRSICLRPWGRHKAQFLLLRRNNSPRGSRPVWEGGKSWIRPSCALTCTWPAARGSRGALSWTLRSRVQIMSRRNPRLETPAKSLAMSMDAFSHPCRRATRIVGEAKTCGGDLECLGPWQRPPRPRDV